MSFQSKKYLVVTAFLSLGMMLLSGCSPQQHLYLTSKGQANRQYIDKGLRIDYPDAQIPSVSEVCCAIEPLTLENPNPSSFWDLSLEEAMQTALRNSNVIRTLNSVSFSRSGVAGIPSMLLSNPAATGTVYDPALVESDPRYGMEAALSAFDAQYIGYADWSRTDSVLNRYGLSATETDVFTLRNTIQKTTAPGGTFYVTNGNIYTDDRGTVGMMGNQWPTSWNAYIEGGFTQPLLQGNGIQFNRIAGPGGQIGFYNGTMIARISADQSLADFEMNARGLVADVEKAYWNLYYAYHYLESVKAGRDSALKTWQQTYQMFQVGHPKGTAKNEAQSRQTYYQFRSQVELAQSNLFKTESVLRYIMGLAATDGRLIRPIDDPTIAPLRLDWNSIVCEALVRSPELRKQKWEVKKKEMELLAAKNYLLPRVDMTANYRVHGLGEWLTDGGSTNRSTAYGNMTGGDYANWGVGIQANMPFGFRKEHAGVRNAQLSLARARAIHQEQELELTHQLADSYRELSQNYIQSQTQLNLRIAAEAEVKAVQLAYDVGTTTLDQVLDALQRLATAETNYYRAVVDYNLSITALHYRKGSLLEYNNVGLTEGPWPNKAYFDAKKLARKRDAGHYMNYGFTRPQVVSRTQHAQFQHGYQYNFEGQAPGLEHDSAPTPAPKLENGIPTQPPVRLEPGKVIETQSSQPVPAVQPNQPFAVPALTTAPKPIPSTGSPASNATPAVAAKSDSSRYIKASATLPL